MSEKMPLGALITAAGLSSRMGTLKALLPFGGGTIASVCVGNMLRAGAEDVVVVTGHRSGEIEEHLAPLGCRFAHNEGYAGNHMFDSVCIGLRALAMDRGRVLISPVDVPCVKAETIAGLLETEGEFVRPVYKGCPGHPVLLDASRIEEILAYGGEGGLKGAIEALGMQVVDMETDDEGVAVDADTPADYERILKLGETG